MKRPIAMLLSLLMTAGLFAFVSCGDGKNYTVKEVDGETRIFLDQSEIDRIYRELDEKGWSVTELKGISEKDIDATMIASWSGPGSETGLDGMIQFAGKGYLTRSPQVFRYDAIYPDGRHASWFMTVCTMKIEEVFYTDGDEKVGDIVKISYSDFLGNPHLDDAKNRGHRLRRIAISLPTTKGAFYTALHRHENDDLYSTGNLMDAAKATADFDMIWNETTIYETEKGVYEFCKTWSSFSKNAEVIPEDERLEKSYHEIYYRLKTDNFDEMFASVINQHLMEVEE